MKTYLERTLQFLIISLNASAAVNTFRINRFFTLTSIAIGFFASSVFAEAPPDIPSLKVKSITTPYKGSTLFVPNDGKPHPGVVVLHGSEGGTWPYWVMEARWLAEEGFAALAFCYASCSDHTESDIYLPRVELHDVELSNTHSALKWLAKSEFVQGKKVALYGMSRGAEQALLLASLLIGDKTNKQADVVAVHAPSDVIWGGWNWQWKNALCTKSDGSWEPNCGVAKSKDIYAWKWRGDYEAVKPATRIAIEKFSGPIFISHGEKDKVWPVEMTRRLQNTLEKAGRHPEVHIFPEQGHILFGYAREKKQRLLLDFFNRTFGK